MLLIGWLVILDVTCATVLANAARRQPGRPVLRRDTLADIALIAGTVPWLILMLWPRPGEPSSISVIPLSDLADQLREDRVSAAFQIGANLAVFAVAGFLGPIRWPVLRSPLLVAALGFGCSALMETAQYALGLGRIASVDDVLLNGGGMLMAYRLGRRWWATEPGRQRVPGEWCSHEP